MGALLSWTGVQPGVIVPQVSRQAFRLRVAFEPTRLGDQPLQTAYEQVVPIRRRRFLKPLTPDSASLPAEETESQQEAS